MAMGLLYTALAVSSLVLQNSIDALEGANQQSNLEQVRGLLTIGTMVGASVQLYKLRRRVYLGMTRAEVRLGFWGPAEGEESTISDGAVAPDSVPTEGPSVLAQEHVSPVSGHAVDPASHPTEERFERAAGWTVVGFGFLFFSVITIGIPIGGVMQTLSSEPNYFWGTNLYATITALSYAAIATVLLCGWLVVGYSAGQRLSLDLAFFAAAIVVNVYLGYGIWVAGAKLLRIPSATSDPHAFGLMVWWNLVDSIPVLDVDSALGWERPLADYGFDLGWLFLLQRLVLLATLARAIQILVNRGLSHGPGGREPENPSGPGSS